MPEATLRSTSVSSVLPVTSNSTRLSDAERRNGAVRPPVLSPLHQTTRKPPAGIFVPEGKTYFAPSVKSSVRPKPPMSSSVPPVFFSSTQSG